MNDSVPAGTAVIPISGNVGTRSWGGDDNGNFFIDFHHFKTPATVEAVGDKCRSKGISVGRPLDGDASAPMPVNGESKEWSW